MRPERVFDRLAHRALGPSESDLAAGLELAVSAHRFSERAQAVVDDKLTFSAALMRAGEVDEARRVLAEVGEEVLAEEVALIERVNEVKVARSMDRQHITRGRLARTLALAMLSSSLLAFSAAGMAVAGLFRGDDQAVHGADPNKVGSVGRDLFASTGIQRRHRIPGLPVRLTSDQLARYKKLTTGVVDEQGLEQFLLGILPPQLAGQVGALVANVMDVADEVKRGVASLTEKVADDRPAPSPDDPNQPKPDETAPDDDGQGSDPDPSPEPSRGERGEEGGSDEDPEDEDEGGIPLLDEDDDDGGQ